jgi:hypothetical protein
MASKSTFPNLSPVACLAVFLSLIVFAVLLAAPTASALPPKQSFKCTMAQVQAAASQACLKQFEDDIMADAAYPHHLVCDETGVFCCQGDGSRTFNCQRVSALKSILPNLLLGPNAPQLQTTPQLQQVPQTTR